MKYLPFDEARELVHSLRLKKQKEWYQYCKSGNKPENIPTSAPSVYKREWKGWGDWIGSGKTRSKKFFNFDDARNFVRPLAIKGVSDWRKFCKSGKKPQTIPVNPDTVYKTNWKGWGDWLGTGTIPPFNREYLDFEITINTITSKQ